MNCVYWNIHAVKNKLENTRVLEILNACDIIWLSEMKSSSNPHLSGYKSFRNSESYDNHGGICMYIKNRLTDFIEEVRFSRDDTVYLTFVLDPNITYCGCYSPPSDSPYYDVRVFADISAVLMESSNRFVLMGDLNAKMNDRKERVD